MSLILLAALSGVSLPMDADSLSDIATFSEKVCHQSLLSGRNTSAGLQSILGSDVHGLAKALGLSVDAGGGLVTQNGYRYNGLPVDQISTPIPTFFRCRAELAKLLIEERRNLDYYQLYSPSDSATPITEGKKIRNTGHTLEKAAHDTGHALEKAGQDTGHATNKEGENLSREARSTTGISVDDILRHGFSGGGNSEISHIHIDVFGGLGGFGGGSDARTTNLDAADAWPDIAAPNKSGNSVDSFLSSLPKGNAIVTAPKVVRAYEEFSIAAHLSIANMPEYSLENTEKNKQSRTLLSNLRIAPRMKATLVGGDFRIANGDAATLEQGVTENGITTWTWHVYVESSGVKTATVKLAAVLKVDGTETLKDFDEGEARIQVKVNALGWAEHHWEYVLSTLVIPLVGWLVPKFLKKAPDLPPTEVRRFAGMGRRGRPKD